VKTESIGFNNNQDDIMRFFQDGLSRLLIIGMNDLACEAAKFCKDNGIEVFVFSGQRFKDLQSIEDENRTCYERMDAIGLNIEELDKLEVDRLSKFKSKDCAVFSFDSPFIFKKDIITFFDGKLFNEHGAHLPHGKGGGGFSWRIMEDDREGNVLFHLLTEGIDAGPIIHQKGFVFPETCRKPLDFMEYQHALNKIELRNFLSRLKNNHDFKIIEQDEFFASYMPRLHTPSQAYIDWSWDVEYIRRFILAFSEPYEGAKTFINGKKIFIYDCYVDSKQIHTHPYKFGIIYNITAEGLRVACKNGTLVITDFRTENLEQIQLGDRFYTPTTGMDNVFSSRVIYTPKGLKKGLEE